MEDTINTLASARDKAGEKVQDLQDKKNEMAIKLSNDPKAYSDEDIAKLTNDLHDAIKVRDFAQSSLDEARKYTKMPKKQVGKGENQVAKKKAKDIKDKFVNEFTDMVTSGVLPEGSNATGPNAGLTIPEDIQTTIHQLVRSFNSLESLVTIENTNMPSGSRVYEKTEDITPLADLDDESGEIGDNDDPELTLIKYAIHRYAGITTVTNTLLQDTAENILAWLINWASKKDVITRNVKILDVLNNGTDKKVPRKATITSFDDIKDLENNTLDPLIEQTSIFLTNQSGFNILSKMKDAEGRYLLQPAPTNPEIYMMGGKTVNVIADKWLPDVSGSHPLYFGDFKQAITLYDRQQMSVVSTNIGAGAFEHDLTKIRFIDRFDVQMIDEGAYTVGSFKNIADQTTGTASTK